jgi:hypothetical protein
LVTVKVEIAVGVPVHVPPENRLYLTVPPAWKKLVRVAESVTEPPTIIAVADKVVAMVG